MPAYFRLGVLGLRILDTNQSNLRLFFQIWNPSDGSIAWEGYQELSYAYDTALEKSATFSSVVEIAAAKPHRADAVGGHGPGDLDGIAGPWPNRPHR
jgi:hypothetical protein